MRFLLDENIRAEIGAWLRAAEHDVVNVPAGSSDAEVFALAEQQRRILLTHDAEFANILRHPPSTHAGIIRLRIHPPAVSVMLHSLETLLRKVPAKDFSRALFVLEKDGFRKRV